MPDYFPTLAQLLIVKRNPEESLALDILWKNRYGHLTHCPQCSKKTKFYFIAGRKGYACSYCGYQIFPAARTIFHKSKTPLHVWFNIIYDLYTSDGKMPAREISRRYNLSYKTGWRLKDIVTKHLRINKSYSYKFSSKKNGRFYQMERYAEASSNLQKGSK